MQFWGKRGIYRPNHEHVPVAIGVERYVKHWTTSRVRGWGPQIADYNHDLGGAMRRWSITFVRMEVGAKMDGENEYLHR